MNVTVEVVPASTSFAAPWKSPMRWPLENTVSVKTPDWVLEVWLVPSQQIDLDLAADRDVPFSNCHASS